MLSILCCKLFYQISSFICSINSLLQIVLLNPFILLFSQSLMIYSIKSFHSYVLSILVCKLFYQICSFICSIVHSSVLLILCCICSINSVHSSILLILYFKLFYQICILICSVHYCFNCSIKSVHSSALSILCCSLFY